jgi:hypothetical protein
VRSLGDGSGWSERDRAPSFRLVASAFAANGRNRPLPCCPDPLVDSAARAVLARTSRSAFAFGVIRRLRAICALALLSKSIGCNPAQLGWGRWDLVPGQHVRALPFTGEALRRRRLSGPQFRNALAKQLPQFAVEIVKRSDSVKGFRVLPRRWVVERTFAWLNRCGRLAKDFQT